MLRTHETRRPWLGRQQRAAVPAGLVARTIEGVGQVIPTQARRISPESLKAVEVPGVLLEDVDEKVALVHEYPLETVGALD